MSGLVTTLWLQMGRWLLPLWVLYTKVGRLLNLPVPSASVELNGGVREGVKKSKRFFLGLCPKLWVGGGQKS